MQHLFALILTCVLAYLVVIGLRHALDAGYWYVLPIVGASGFVWAWRKAEPDEKQVYKDWLARLIGR